MQLKRGAWYRRGTASGRLSAREVALLHCHGGPLGGRVARTLYDLIGASADDDAERLRKAFHKAVKANHPDLHPGDPEATVRLSGIVRAYAILRDAHERASYDQALELERASLRSKPKRFGTMRRFFAEAGSIAALTVALSAGYVLVANVAQFSLDGKVSDVRGPPTITAVELAGREGAVSGGTTEGVNKQPVGVTGTDRAVTGSVEELGVANDQANQTIASTPPRRDHEVADQNQKSKPAPVAAPIGLSSLGNTTSKSSPPSASRSERKHRTEVSDLNSPDARKSTTRERPRLAEITPPSEHASDKSPLFGIGY
jgi:curved DNA-binding protein CbpA